MTKQEILRQLQSRIDKRSNEITSLEVFYEGRIAQNFIERHEYELMDELRHEQTLDKRIYGLILRMDNHCFELECSLINTINAANMYFKVS